MATKARLKRSTVELRQASGKLTYELNMLFGCLIELRKIGRPQEDREGVVYNAFIHAFLIQVRNMRAFLYAVDPRPNDIIAEDFFDSATEWTTRRPGETKISVFNDNALLRKIHRHLAHLTWDRVEKEKPTWPLGAIAQELSDITCAFAALVDPSRLDESFKTFLPYWRATWAVGN